MTSEEATAIAVIKNQLEYMTEDMLEMKKKLQKMENDRQHLLLWGIMTLGAGMIGLVSFIATWIFKPFSH